MDFRIIKLSKTNCYLFRLSIGWMLMDCGYEHDQKKLDKGLKKNNITYNDIKWLFLTHHHDDHAGLVNYIIEMNPEIKIIMHKSCSELISSGRNQRFPGGGWASRGAKYTCEVYGRFNLNWTLSFPPYSERDEYDYLIENENDQLLQKLGLEAEIMFTPGHTPDSISILDDKGNLFCGDAAANYLQWTGTKYSPLYISELDKYYKSWGKIIESKTNKIFPAHGKAFDVNKLVRYKDKIKNLAKFNWDRQ